MVFHPWRALRANPSIVVDWEPQDGLYGIICGDHVTISPGLTQAERRCTIAHEMVHHERSVVAGDELATIKEERVVDELAARQLIPLEDLVDKLLWSLDEHELAEDLWVDIATVRARLAGLTTAEKAEIEAAIRRKEEGMQWD